MSRPPWELLVGSSAKLDYLSTLRMYEDVPHRLQMQIEEIIESQLDDDEKDIYYMRFGQLMTIRAIATELGYTYHAYVQRKLDRIIHKVRVIVVEEFYDNERASDGSSD